MCESSVVLEYISSRLMNVHKLTFDVNRRTENLEKVPPCVSNDCHGRLPLYSTSIRQKNPTEKKTV